MQGTAARSLELGDMQVFVFNVESLHQQPESRAMARRARAPEKAQSRSDAADEADALARMNQALKAALKTPPQRHKDEPARRMPKKDTKGQ